MGLVCRKLLRQHTNNHAITCTNFLERKAKIFSMILAVWVIWPLTSSFSVSSCVILNFFLCSAASTLVQPSDLLLNTMDALFWLSIEFSFLPWCWSPHWFLFVLPISTQAPFPQERLCGSRSIHSLPVWPDSLVHSHGTEFYLYLSTVHRITWSVSLLLVPGQSQQSGHHLVLLAIVHTVANTAPPAWQVSGAAWMNRGVDD